MENTSQGNEAQNLENTTLCPVFLFRYFVRSNFEDIKASNEELDEINQKFSEYLKGKFTQEQLSRFLPKSPFDVIINKDHPFRTNGFEPAFVLHFLDYVKIEMNRINASV